MLICRKKCSKMQLTVPHKHWRNTTLKRYLIAFLIDYTATTLLVGWIQDIAAYIKKEFDKKYNPTWHCIVGRNFGSYVTHETRHFIYFYLGQVAILLFKSGWETITLKRNIFTNDSVTQIIFYYTQTIHLKSGSFRPPLYLFCLSR